MVKLVVYFKRRADMEVELFQEYWRTRHAEVVCGLPGIRRYVQSHTLLAGYRKGEPAFDGIAEVWFDDTDAIRALDGTDMLRAVQEDEAKFIDRSTMKTLVTDEHLIKDGERPDGCVEEHRVRAPPAGPWGRGVPALLARGARPPRKRDPRDPSLRAEPLPPGRLCEGAPAPLRRGRDHLVREHRRDARGGPGPTPTPGPVPTRPTSSRRGSSLSSSPGSTWSSPERVPPLRCNRPPRPQCRAAHSGDRVMALGCLVHLPAGLLLPSDGMRRDVGAKPGGLLPSHPRVV